MKIRFLLLCIIATCSVNLFAQEASITKIRESYEQVQERIAEDYYTPIVATYAINRAVIGTTFTTVKIYRNNMEAETYDDVNNPGEYIVKRILYYVTVEYNIAASVKYHIEYLYNDKAELIFCFYQEVSGYDNLFKEIRFYYDSNKLIKYSD